MAFEEALEDEAALLERMSRPDAEVEAAIAQANGPILVLGVGGKMGPTLARMLVRAGAEEVIGVSRFSDEGQRRWLEEGGVRTLRADLSDEGALKSLPDAASVYMLAGFKFGATGNEALTWAMNAWLPGQVLQRFAGSRVVYVSSGNVYAYTPNNGRGASEDGVLAPVGEYAQSRLGGERLAEYFARRDGTPLAVVRLFYATELRYGIIHDIAWKVWHGEPIDLAMGYVNQVWQGDANAYLARMLPLCADPPTCVNLTGPEVLSVRHLAEELGRLLEKEPVMHGAEEPEALLGDSRWLFERLGTPSVDASQIVAWVAEWVRRGGSSLGKPTKYESRSGRF